MQYRVQEYNILRRAEGLHSRFLKICEANSCLKKACDELAEVAKPNNTKLSELEVEVSSLKSQVAALAEDNSRLQMLKQDSDFKLTSLMEDNSKLQAEKRDS